MLRGLDFAAAGRACAPVMNMTKGIMVCLLAVAASGRAGEFRLESAGVRFGFSNNSIDRRFFQTEGFARCNLPWRWELGTNWNLRPQLDLSAGWLSGRGKDGFIGTVGPGLSLSRKESPLSFVGGINPTLLSRQVYGDKDFGIPFQFTSYAGLNLKLGSSFDVGYRFQHMSNAGLGSHNSGLSLNMFSVGYRF